MQKVGEYLRFDSALPPRLSEFATLIVARTWTQQFEWFVHVPLALKAGTSQATIDALRDGRRPHDMSDDEALVHDFSVELLQHHGVCDATYGAAVARLGERGVIDLVGLVGYFAMVSMVLNVARTPAEVPPAPSRCRRSRAECAANPDARADESTEEESGRKEAGSRRLLPAGVAPYWPKRALAWAMQASLSAPLMASHFSRATL